ncbi:MAG: hypothetical protein ACRD2W_07630 [Acidimicrobiales bacterium]
MAKGVGGGAAVGRPQVIDGTDAEAGVRIAYVKGRGVLRLSGPAIADGIPVEIPFAALLDGFAGEVPGFDRSPRYVLFGALHRETRGGTADVIGVFDCEDIARKEFIRLRQRRRDRDGWAELAKLDGRGRLRRIAWFGRVAFSGIDDTADRGADSTEREGRPGRRWAMKKRRLMPR